MTQGANVIKRFVRNFRNSHNKLVFVLGKPFQPSLMFSAKARNHPIEVLFRSSTLG
jgi:hypothetical protein